MRVAIGKKLRFQIFQRDSHTCQYCGACAPDVKLHVDHIKPVSEGGTNDHDNLLTACSACNLGKGSDDAYVSKREFAEVVGDFKHYVYRDIVDRFGVDFLDGFHGGNSRRMSIIEQIDSCFERGVSLLFIGEAAACSKSFEEWEANLTSLISDCLDGEG